MHVRPNSNTVLISVPESAVGKTAAHKFTSLRKLASLKAKIASDLGISVDFLLVRDNLQNQIESGLNGLLVSMFPKLIKEALLSYNSDGIYDVWLEPTEDSSSDSESIVEIRAAVEKYFKLFSVKLGLLKAADGFDLPSLTQILRAAKRLSPVNAAALFDALKELRLKAPSVSWVEGKLDKLRRQELVVRSADGTYSLTEAGLAIVPHDRTRHSSDVERALAFGRRKW
jgi:hypothetical protein